MKIKFGKATIKAPYEKCFATMFSMPNPEFLKELFSLTYSSYTNYLEECTKCAEKYTKTSKSDKSHDD
ncbi:hypothetical protein [Desulfosporosinus sp. BG]|uniref:hypothetical protein n=1 Tax=Desulfosporosinus sp. BG TaxID=1633135 RepID=UPI00083B9013|nr:hypothetical protein [Desulfosporosinus sp. BG]ODA40014.1 hypothetical protein DSBG_3220 [Desulfosporosinus sp. BG]